MVPLNKVLAAVVLLSLPAALCGEEPAPVHHWGSPLYWQPTGTRPAGASHTRSMLVEGGAVVPSPLPFVAMTPCRVVDTRSANGPFGGPILPAATARRIDLPSGPCPGIPVQAAAYSLNVTVTGSPSAPPGSFLTLWPAGEPMPVVSTLNYGAGQTIANAAIVAAGAGGAIGVISSASTHVILDVNGYYMAPPAAVAAGAGVNPMQIALLRWYPVNLAGTRVNVGEFPVDVVFDGTAIWVASFSGQSVTKVRVSDGAVLGSYAAGEGPDGLLFDGMRIWVSNFSGGTVTRLRASDGVNLGTSSVGSGPARMAFDGANVWVANSGSNDVTKVRASDGTPLATYAVGLTPTAVAFDGASVWVTTRGDDRISKLRPTDGTLLATIPVGSAPAGLVFDGASVWVANSSSNDVTRIRAVDGVTLGTFAVGVNPIGVVFDGTSVWVASNGSGSVTKLRASDGANQGSFTVGTGPTRMAFDGANVWVVCEGTNSVTKL